jgi:hypothetical protein
MRVLMVCTLLVSATALQLPSFTTKKATTLRSSVDDAAWPRPSAPPLLQTLGISRDRALKSLATLDRGEFRWEFLTPWVDRDLTRTDKVIVCSTFIGLAIGVQELVEPSTAVWKSTSVSGALRGDDAAVLDPSSGEEPAPPRHRTGVASMAWRTTR